MGTIRPQAGYRTVYRRAVQVKATAVVDCVQVTNQFMQKLPRSGRVNMQSDSGQQSPTRCRNAALRVRLAAK